MPLRSGFVSVVGLPNAGKSTLVNALVGEKVAIVTRKPQTTRNRIHGVLEVEAVKGRHPAAQIVFVDTPGVHQPGNLLDRRMLQEVYDALESRDVVLHVVDATRRVRVPAAGGHSIADENGFLLGLVKKLECPVFLVLNKIDAVDEKATLLPLIAQLSALHTYAEVIPVSARGGDGLDRLIDKLVEYMPEGRRHFPKGQYTDQPERFLAAEIIREKILNLTGEEVPYASAVAIERFEYAWVRHPIYTGILLALLGNAVLSGRLAVLLAVAAVTLALWLKLRTEERFMTETFGEQYTAYRRWVKALIPYLM